MTQNDLTLLCADQHDGVCSLNPELARRESELALELVDASDDRSPGSLIA
jgi:hypothetical protein